MFIRILRDKICRFVSYHRSKYIGVCYNISVTIDPTSTFEGANSIGEKSFFKGRMGYGAYIGANCYIDGNIGRFTSISSDVQCNLGSHPYKYPYVSTSPMFFSLLKQTGETFATKQMFQEIKPPIQIGNDCWVGQRVFIVGGVNIGDGAVILAGAVVVKNVPPYAIVGGVPAKIIGYRYDSETIDVLRQMEWWNMPIVWLKKHYELFSDIDSFVNILKQTENKENESKYSNDKL